MSEDQVDKIREDLDKEVLGFAVKYWLLLLVIVLFVIAYRKKQLPDPIQNMTSQVVGALPPAITSSVDMAMTQVENAAQGTQKYYY